MNARTARTILHAACASYTVACDGAGPARRGWFVSRGGKVRCWLGATAQEAVAALRPSERTARTGRDVFGVCNVAFHATRPEGTETWFTTRAARDAALVTLRDRALGAGLAVSAARSGIYPIVSTVTAVRGRVGPGVQLTDELADLIY